MNYKEAVEWYRKAAEQGYSIAQHNMGTAYLEGVGVSKDYIQAAEWYRKAADGGHYKAQNRLGVMYEYGVGVSQDYVQAHMWYKLALAGGVSIKDESLIKLAKKNLHDISRKMTPEQIDKADKLGSEWIDQWR